MTTLNSYATLTDYKNYIKSRGGDALRDDTTDDGIIETLLKAASKYIESQTGRRFTPWVETRYYDVPSTDDIDPRVLKLDDDLLEILTLTNGDGTTIASTEYSLRPRNSTPHRAIRLIDNSTYYWASDGAGDTHDVISVSGIWGYHDNYSGAWSTATTANEAMDASETEYTVTSSTGFVAGNLIRFDNELGYLSSVASGTSVNITRGANGSTATTHLTSIDIKVWQVIEEAKLSCLEIANNAYHRRWGKSNGNIERVTAAGIVLMPLDIPKMAQDFINSYRRYV